MRCCPSADGSNLLFGNGGKAMISVWTQTRGFVLLVGFLVSLFGGLQTAYAQQTVVVRGAEHPGYVRIVFEWPEEVGFNAKISDNELRVGFAQAFTANYSAIQTRLANFIGAPLPSDGNREVRIPLRRAFELKTIRADNRVVIDLLKPEALPQVAVRGAEHPEYARIVFEWPEAVGFDAKIIGNELQVRFDRAFAADYTAVRQRLSESIGAPSPSDGGEAVRIPLRRPFGLKTMRLDNRIAIDLLKRAPAEPEVATAPVSEAPVQGPTVADVVSERTAAEIEADRMRAQVLEQQAQDLAEQQAREAMAAELAEARAVEQAQLAAQQSEGDLLDIELRVKEIAGGMRLRFPFPEDVAAAVFFRGSLLWVVFDKPAQVDLSILSLLTNGMVIGGEQVPDEQATILAFKVAPGMLAHVDRRRAVWQVDLLREYEEPAGILPVIREPNAEPGALVRVRVANPTGPFKLFDPEVGDVILVSPVLEVSQAVASGRRYVEFEILDTSQGVAVIPFTDRVQVQARPGFVDVATPEGLQMSDYVSRALGASDVGRSRQMPPGFMDFDRWRRGTAETFHATRAQLREAVATAESEERGARRLALARFYLAHGLAAEARGTMQVMVSEDNNAATDLYFHALSGVVHYFLGRYDEAARSLGNAGLRNDPHTALWLAANHARQAEWQQALAAFDKGFPVIEKYSGRVAAEMRLLAAAAALNRGEFERAERELASVPVAGLGIDLLTEAWLLRGRVLEAAGDTDEAIGAYNMVLAEHHRPTEVRARLSKLLLLNRLGSVGDPQALEGLETLRYAWRGDDTELRILEALGDRYIAVGKYRDGLTIMRNAVSLFPQTERSGRIAGRMAEVFSELYLDGGAERMTPIKALALYYDFRELTPLGKDGDEMIRRLGERLVAVDLLDEAAELLDHQVRFRLKGTAKAQVAARLSVIQLLDNKPGLALETIRRTRQTRLPADLSRRRLILEARALTELGEYEQALELIEATDTPDARLLRADIHWAAQDWSAAATSMERILANRWQQDRPLDRAEQSQVIRVTIAYALAGEQTALDRIRGRYDSKMQIGNYADAFDVITQSPEAQGVAFRQLAGTIASIDTLQDFMQSYRGDSDTPLAGEAGS